jgi:multiple sugar transport system ATP-binding protein
MATVELINVSKSFGSVEVLRDINLALGKGRVRGLRRPLGLRQVHAAADDRGARGHHRRRARIDGQPMNDLLPAERGIAMVFQSYALYPHMTCSRTWPSG